MKILPPFQSDAATFQVATSSAIDAGFPITNLQTPAREQVMWTTTGDVTIKIDFGKVVLFSGVGWAESNLLPTAEVTVTAWSAQWAGSELYSATVSAYPSMSFWDAAYWDISAWDGLPTPDDLEVLPNSSAHFFDAVLTRWVSVRINNGTTPFYLGRLLAGTAWSASHEVNYGATTSWGSTTVTTETPARRRFSNLGRRYLIWDFDMLVTKAEAEGPFYTVASRMLSDHDGIMEALSTAGRLKGLHCVYGRFVEPPSISWRYPNHAVVTAKFEEA